MGIVPTAARTRQDAPPPPGARDTAPTRRRAAQAARSILARAEFLADAPAGQLATPFMVRQAARGMARDARELLAELLADTGAPVPVPVPARAAADGSEGAPHAH